MSCSSITENTKLSNLSILVLQDKIYNIDHKKSDISNYLIVLCLCMCCISIASHFCIYFMCIFLPCISLFFLSHIF